MEGMSKCSHLSVSALPSHIALLTMRSSLKQADSPARLQRHCAWWRAPLKYRRVIFCEGSRIIAGMILKKIGWEGVIPFDLASAFGQSFLHRFRRIRSCRRTVWRCGTLMHTESLQIQFLLLTNFKYDSPSARRAPMTRTA